MEAVQPLTVMNSTKGCFSCRSNKDSLAQRRTFILRPGQLTNGDPVEDFALRTEILVSKMK